jgi:hypothetical protein
MLSKPVAGITGPVATSEISPPQIFQPTTSIRRPFLMEVSERRHLSNMYYYVWKKGRRGRAAESEE